MAVCLAACDQDSDAAQIARRNQHALDFFRQNKVGISENYVIFKTGQLTGVTEPVAVIFGFADNASACGDMATRFNSDESNAYHCEIISQQH